MSTVISKSTLVSHQHVYDLIAKFINECNKNECNEMGWSVEFIPMDESEVTKQIILISCAPFAPRTPRPSLYIDVSNSIRIEWMYGKNRLLDHYIADIPTKKLFNRFTKNFTKYMALYKCAIPTINILEYGPSSS